MQGNGYKPAPLDLSAVTLTTKMEELVDSLAENTHNLWAKERITQGWTYGLNEDPDMRRSPHLVPYSKVDELIKKANRFVFGLSSHSIEQFLFDFLIFQRHCQ